MHRALTSSAISRAPVTLRSVPLILKRKVNANYSLKSPRRVSQTQAGNATMSLAAVARFSSIYPLTWSQVQSILVSSSIPMVGFGFMDNFVMIQAGGYIDSTIGVQLGLATLTAAAMGQVVSDVSGVLFGGSLERMLSPYIKSPQLTAAQLRLPLVARLRLAGAVCGVIVGCLLGATSLYFVLDESSARPVDHLLQLQAVVQDMLIHEINGASCTVYVKGANHSLPSKKGVRVTSLSENNSAVNECTQSREVVMDGEKIYVPIVRDDDVVAVMEIASEETGFSQDQQYAANRMARNIGIFMNHILAD